MFSVFRESESWEHVICQNETVLVAVFAKLIVSESFLNILKVSEGLADQSMEFPAAAQLVERWTKGTESPGSSRAGSR